MRMDVMNDLSDALDRHARLLKENIPKEKPKWPSTQVRVQDLCQLYSLTHY